MAVTAKFTADFSSFLEAIDKAEVALVDLSKGSSKVEGSLNRMVDNFSGRKLIQEAALMTIAIEKAGGVSTLTAAELEKVGTKASDAAEKLKALGIEVPKGIQDIATAADDARKKIEGMGGPTGQITTSMLALGTAVGTFVGHLAADVFQKFVSGAGDLVSSGLKMNATLETTTLKFTTLMGDSDKAAAHVKDLFEIAKKTPFETGPIIEASLKLQTFGGAALNTKDNIMLLGDASAATGAPINELGMWVGRLYSNLKAGQPFGEAALRLQELAVLTPKARQEMENLQKQGKSGAEVFDAFKGSLGAFTGAMTAQAGTWEGVMSTFTDTVNIMVAGVLKPYFEVIRDVMKAVNDGLDGAGESFDGVKASAEGSKQAFADFVTGGADVVIKSISFLMVEFNAAKVVFGDVAQLFEILNLNAAKLARIQLKSSDLFGIDADTQAKIKAVEADIAKMTASIEARGKALQGDKQAEKDWVDWSDKAVASLNEMLANVGKASTSLEVHKNKVDDTAEGTKKLTAEQNAYAKALADYNSVGRSAVDTVNKMNGAVVEGIRFDIARGQSLSAIGKIYGVTSEQIKAIIAVDKEEIQTEKDHQTSLDNTIKHIQDFEKTGVDGAKAVALGMGGGLTVLKDLSIQMGDTQLAASKSFAGMTTFVGDWSAFTEAKMRRVKDVSGEFEKGLGELGRAFGELGRSSNDGLASVGQAVANTVGSMEQASKGVDTFKNGLANSDFAGAAAGIVGIAAAMDQATASTSRWQATLQGAAVGASVGGIYGAAAGALIGWIRSAGAAERAINPLRQAFIDSAGGLAKLNEEAKAAGTTLDKLLQAKNADQYQAAFRELTAALEKHKAEIEANNKSLLDMLASGQDLGIKLPAAMMQSIQTMIDLGQITGDAADAFRAYAGNTEVDFAKMEETAKKYNISLDDLGKPFWAAKLHDAAATLIDDFDLLTKNGGNADAVLAGMKPKIQDLVTDSLKFGIAIPENMKPWIDQLIKTGQLLDDNGNQITDISQLDFAPPIVSGFDKIVNKLQELIDKLTGTGTGSLAGSFDAMPGILERFATISHEKTGQMIKDWRDVGDEVNAVSFGHSPGGIKEIPIQLGKANAAMIVTAGVAEKQFGLVYDAIDTVIDNTDGWGVRIDDIKKKVADIPDGIDAIIRKTSEVPDHIDDIIKKTSKVPDGIEGWKPPIDDFIKKVSGIPDTLDDIIKKIADIPDSIDIHVATSGPDGLQGTTDTGNHVWNDPVGSFANGGMVEAQYAAMGRLIQFPGRPRGTDTVPAWLTPGEGIVNRKGMKQLGPAGLAALNRGEAGTQDNGAVVDAIEALAEELARQRRDLPKQIRDALLVAGRRSA